jgi:hypothetical protein
VHKAAAVNSQPPDRVVAAVNSQPPLHKAPAGEAVAEAVKQVAAVAAVVAVVAAVKLTLPRQAPETFARFSITGAGIWACCAAKRKTI